MANWSDKVLQPENKLHGLSNYRVAVRSLSQLMNEPAREAFPNDPLTIEGGDLADFKRRNLVKCYNNLNLLYLAQLTSSLEALSNCLRPVFSLGVSQHENQITICENLGSTSNKVARK